MTADPNAFAPASKGNMALLVQLRWMAVIGQLLTIWVVWDWLGVRLPLVQLVSVPVLLALVNLATIALFDKRRGYSYIELLGALMLDVQALSWQLYYTGGATNPFIFLFLLQIVIGAILLHPRWSWIVALVASLDVTFLTISYRPLALPAHYTLGHFQLYLYATLICFMLIAALMVFLVVRMDRNRRRSDAALAGFHQQATEENHIIRLGLLATGAAHELGTPLASMSVILGDWLRHKAVAQDADLAADVADMQAELARCKSILTGILMSAGEVRGENPAVTSLRAFLNEIISDWRARTSIPITFSDKVGDDLNIVSDPALRQVIGNVVDNALDVSPHGISIEAWRRGATLILDVSDDGPGFSADMLAHFGRPYASTKGRPGGGLGLFLVINVLRKLGGRAEVGNLDGGGAMVRLSIPLSALAYASKGGT